MVSPSSCRLQRIYCGSFSAHNAEGTKDSDRAADLDQALGSCFALQLVANIFVTGGTVFVCGTTETEFNLLQHLRLLLLGCPFIIRANVLTHRYLLKKAKIMTKLMNDKNDPATAWLDLMDKAFVVEERAIFFITCVPLFAIHKVAGLAMALFAFLFFIVMDTFFSVSATFLFLRPIVKVMKETTFALVQTSFPRPPPWTKPCHPKSCH